MTHFSLLNAAAQWGGNHAWKCTPWTPVSEGILPPSWWIQVSAMKREETTGKAKTALWVWRHQRDDHILLYVRAYGDSPVVAGVENDKVRIAHTHCGKQSRYRCLPASKKTKYRASVSFTVQDLWSSKRASSSRSRSPGNIRTEQTKCPLGQTGTTRDLMAAQTQTVDYIVVVIVVWYGLVCPLPPSRGGTWIPVDDTGEEPLGSCRRIRQNFPCHGCSPAKESYLNFVFPSVLERFRRHLLAVAAGFDVCCVLQCLDKGSVVIALIGEKFSRPGLRCCEPSGFCGSAWVCEFQTTNHSVTARVVSHRSFGGAAGFCVFCGSWKEPHGRH